MDPIIHLDSVSMRFRMNLNRPTSLKEWVVRFLKRDLKSEDFFALKNVSFDIPKGAVVGIIGRNGSGKSTVLKVISGIYKPASGVCTTEGRIAPMLELGSGFDFELTGHENIFLNGAILGFDEKSLKDRYQDILDFSELGNFIHQPIKTYSSGMMTRLAFSIATIVEPDILIVDEILSVGDENFQRKSYKRMMELMHSGCTVLMVSHNLEQIRSMCSKVIWLDHGTVRMDGDTQTVCDAYAEFMKNEE